LPWKADSPDPLTPPLTKGDGLPDRGAAGRFDAEQLIFNFNRSIILQEPPFAETKFHSFDDGSEQFTYCLAAWLGNLMKERTLFFPADRGPVQDQKMKMQV
jgi:hypothetical protein